MLVVNVALAVAGCAAEPHAPLVCDATQSDRIAFGYALPSQSGSELMRANGRDFLVITGDCRYFVQPAGGFVAWEPVHHGVLTEEQLDGVNAELLTLPWASYPAISGPSGAIDDVGPFMERDQRRIVCGVDCGPAAILCGADCIDTMMNTDHCGGCDQPCAIGQVCTDGACACAPEQALCDLDCVDLQVDTKNCGDCAMTCEDGQMCTAGACE